MCVLPMCRRCSKCHRFYSYLPDNIYICPYCHEIEKPFPGILPIIIEKCRKKVASKKKAKD